MTLTVRDARNKGLSHNPKLVENWGWESSLWGVVEQGKRKLRRVVVQREDRRFGRPEELVSTTEVLRSRTWAPVWGFSLLIPGPSTAHHRHHKGLHACNEAPGSIRRPHEIPQSQYLSSHIKTSHWSLPVPRQHKMLEAVAWTVIKIYTKWYHGSGWRTHKMLPRY